MAKTSPRAYCADMNPQELEAGRYPASIPMNIIDELQTDLALAAECDACVLLTAEPGLALDVARQIASHAQDGRKAIDILDCDVMDGTVMSAALHLRTSPTISNGHGILLMREVQALGPRNQRLLADLLDLRQGGKTPRLVASSSVSLYERVQRGLFDERLFYKLNTIHITVHPAGERA